MLTREWSDWRDGWMVWLQSVYVRQDCRGQGVFRGMLDHVMSVLEETPGVAGLRLYVASHNTRAQAVYRRSGFATSRYRILEKHFDKRPHLAELRNAEYTEHADPRGPDS
jgi:ribosomal protein S18 acetylase RimI-like enzyme